MTHSATSSGWQIDARCSADGCTGRLQSTHHANTAPLRILSVSSTTLLVAIDRFAKVANVSTGQSTGVVSQLHDGREDLPRA
eukprot:COSAG04_NODE_3034_length_3251_cov_224.076777_7_plen_82_part_00